MSLDEASWLLFERAPGETLRVALERTLRDSILAGALRQGARLPASRALAHQLGVSRGVVTDAYAQLEAQGFLTIALRAAPLVTAVPRPDAVHWAPESVLEPVRFDLTPTTPDVTLFPVSRWLAAAQHVLRQATPATLDYRESRGERPLREVLAEHLGRTRGVIADPAQIVIVQGTAQGIDIALRILKARGASRIAVEDPSHTTLHARVQAMGFTLDPQPVDADGIVVDRLDADAVIVTPAHQFPTGVVLSGERRGRLLAWSRETGGLIIEDDYDSEFRYDREPVRALQGLAPEHVIQLGTVSKTLVPALRLGWLVAPPSLAADVARMKLLIDDFSPALDQLILAEFLRRGDYVRHVRRARGQYRSRRDRLLARLAAELPGLAVEGIAAGVHLVLRLPTGSNDAVIAAAAAEEGIRVPPLSEFRLRPSLDGGLVIGYGRLPESAVVPAIRALAKVILAHPPG